MKKAVVASIIVPVHNQEQYIGRCIRSLLNQNYTRENYEIIVINDACTDNTHKAIHVFKEELRVFVNKEQLGLPGSLNRGIREARGQFIIRVDADDYVHAEYVNILAMHLAVNDYMDAVCCDYQLVGADEKIIAVKKWFEEPIGCGIMFRIEDIIKLGLYDEELKIHEDKDLLLRFLEKHNIYSIPLPLYRYRRHSNNITNRTDDMQRYMEILQKKYPGNLIAERILK
jgi:glycosyltransferase involved in cell wall biosynthesis